MFMPTKDFLKRITIALEHVAAPLIEDDFARGQVLAAVFLLDNLSARIDYKPEIIMSEIEKCCETIKAVAGPVSEKSGGLPEELKAFMDELDQKGPGNDLAFRNRCDKMLSLAINLFFDNRGKLDPELDLELDGLIIKYITNINMRDLGMMQLSTSSKLIQAKDKD